MASQQDDLLVLRPEGLYCPRGDFYIDPWRSVPYAVITHGHSDHAKAGHRQYVCHRHSVPVLQHRLGIRKGLRGVAYGEVFRRRGVSISLHPAGHIPGSAQVLVAYRGDRWVVSGDYKTHDDGFCPAFEPVRCRVFITESTFGLPVYRWPDATAEMARINAWWAANQAAGKTSVLVGYALGKAQRLLAGVDPGLGPIYAHGAILAMTNVVRTMGYALPPLLPVDTAQRATKSRFRGALVMAAPSAIGTSWMKRFEPASLAFASGWMALRGPRRRRAADRGFVISDHADWDGLNAAVEATGAERLLVTHGYQETFSRWWREKGLDAASLATAFEGERAEIGESQAQSQASSDSQNSAQPGTESATKPLIDTPTKPPSDPQAETSKGSQANPPTDAPLESQRKTQTDTNDMSAPDDRELPNPPSSAVS